MSRLIITPENCDFVVFDMDAEKITHRQGKTKALDCTNLQNMGRDTYRPFGIADDADSIYIASNDRLGKFNKTTYEFEKLFDIPLWINTHQILKDGEKFYTCNTAIDTIGVYGLERLQLSINYMNVVEQKFQPRYADELDSRHVNTLYDAGDKIYFIRHNQGIGPSDIGFFDKRTLTPQILTKVGKCCHGIEIVKNVLYTLSTQTGELISVNLDTLIAEKFNIVDPAITFLRGLEYYDGKLIIGCSVNFKTNGKDKSCYIIVVDMKNISHKKYVLDGIKTINDLKILT
jgi:hypothetical protein